MVQAGYHDADSSAQGQSGAGHALRKLFESGREAVAAGWWPRRVLALVGAEGWGGRDKNVVTPDLSPLLVPTASRLGR